MGKLINSVIGDIKGTIGEIVGSSRYGKPYIKGKYKSRTKKVRPKERQNRIKFAMAQSWLKPVLDYVRQGFNGFCYSPSSMGFVAAKSHLLLNAFVGTAPDISIDPALVKVSYGNLAPGINHRAEKIDERHIRFSWENQEGTNASEYDQVMMLAYDTARGDADMMMTGAFRKNGEDTLKVHYPSGSNPGTRKGGTFHCYMAFVAADRSRQSESVYLGTITF